MKMIKLRSNSNLPVKFAFCKKVKFKLSYQTQLSQTSEMEQKHEDKRLKNHPSSTGK